MTLLVPELGDAAQARRIFRQLEMKVLIARVYDPVWNDLGGCVEARPQLVAQEQLRALGCR